MKKQLQKINSNVRIHRQMKFFHEQIKFIYRIRSVLIKINVCNVKASYYWDYEV